MVSLHCKPLTSKQIHDKHAVKNAYTDFWNNIKFKKGWEKPALELSSKVEDLLDRAAEIVVCMPNARDLVELLQWRLYGSSMYRERRAIFCASLNSEGYSCVINRIGDFAKTAIVDRVNCVGNPSQSKDSDRYLYSAMECQHNLLCEVSLTLYLDVVLMIL
jgi:hypothetical protein